jgi:DNA-binding beta-propeller fold protein YncE
MGSMSARRFVSTVVPAAVSVLACSLAFSSGAFAAGSTMFGGPGVGAGKLNAPMGVGLDPETGDVYVGDFENERVSKFDASGSFLFGWGWGVNGEHPAAELQTCTTATGCLKGESGSGAGQFASSCGAEGVAVDNDSLSASYRDVYVVDFCNFRVQKFDPEGKFLLTFGGHVNETTKGNVCVAGEACTKGTEGAASGEFEWAYRRTYIAIGPGGNVYVGDKARIQVFEPSGAWKESVSLAGLSSEGKVTALAVDSAGDMFAVDEGVAGVHELEPSGSEKAFKCDAASTSIEAITANPAGGVFLADSSGGLHLLECDPSGREVASFGSNIAGGVTAGIAFSAALSELYVSNFSESVVRILQGPVPGPFVVPGSEIAAPGLHGAATLRATIDPEGNDSSYRFEYVDDTKFKASGFTGAASTPTTPVGGVSEDFEEHPVEAVLPEKTLIPGVTYHWRVVASDTAGHTTLGPSESFEETPAALIEGPWAANVASSSATITANVDPLASNTSYRLQVSGPSYERVFSGDLGEGNGYVSVGPFHIQGLQASATYRYKLTATSETGTVESTDRTFTTQAIGSELTLPDGRAWELVSPPDKKGALIGPSQYELTQAAADGGGITYTVAEPVGEDVKGHIYKAQELSTRGPYGWRTRDLSGRGGLPPEGQSTQVLFRAEEFWPLFSSDLSEGLLEPGRVPAPQSPEATERTLYLGSAASGSFLPLESPSNVPTGLKFQDAQMMYLAATPDLGNIVFSTRVALTPEAVEKPLACEDCYDELNLYEWHEGRFQLINIFPDGTTHPGEKITLGGLFIPNGGEMVARAISDDGRFIVWKNGERAFFGNELFVRDMVRKQTVKLGHRYARFENMSRDGSKVFFTDTEEGYNGDLYVYEPISGKQTDLTAVHGAGELSAGVQNGLLGISDDGSYAYFVATGALASGAVSGADNLYLLHEGASGWETRFVATLSREDEHTWGGSDFPYTSGTEGNNIDEPWLVQSEVSPSGRYLAFMSDRPLTGYDNVDALSGQRDEEVFVYDAAGGGLACVSCDPSGARPVGVLDAAGASGGSALLVDSHGAWLHPTEHWLAGSLDGWNQVGPRATYHPRFMLDNGRVFFDSPGALVPQDTNGLEDVYEYEPPGVGSCTSGGATFSEASRGCVNLISAGQSSAESAFMDSSETGNDVFFATSEKLAGEDYDTAYDMYDAHVCSASAPCHTTPVAPPECTSGDSCKAAPASQPVIFGPAPSATFNGQGNVTASAKTAVAGRSLTRAQKLARALTACRKKKGRHSRSTCERRMRGRYGAKQSRAAKATERGNR